MRWYHYIKVFIPLIAVVLLFFIFQTEILRFVKVNKDSLDGGRSAATIIGGFFGLVTLILIWLQLVVQNRQARLAKTYEITSKLQDIKFIMTSSKAAIYFADKSKTEDVKWHDYMLGKMGVFYPVYLTLAFFEDIALLYNNNQIDRGLINRLLRKYIITNYEDSEWFRKRMKAKYGDSMYKEFDNLYERIKRTDIWISAQQN